MDNSAPYARGLKVYDTRAGITKFVTSHPKFFGLFFLLGLISVGFFAYKYLTAPKILASVNGIPIYEKYLEEKIKNGCMITPSTTREQAVGQFINFLVLQEGAKQLGIIVTLDEVKKNINKQSPSSITICPEEYQKRFLQEGVKQKIMPFRAVEHLIVEKSKEKELQTLVKSYDTKSYKSFYFAAKDFLSDGKNSTSQGYSIFLRNINHDTKKTGVYEDQIIYDTVFTLKNGQISTILKPAKGSAANKLVVLRITEAGDTQSFSTFSAWFSNFKKTVNIKRFDQ